MKTNLDPRRRARRRLLLPATLLMLAAPALAQQPSQAQIGAIRQACRSDYQAHCTNVPTGGAAALDCLKQNMASLSAPCRQAVGAAGGGAAAGAAATAPTAAVPAQPPAAPPPPMSPRQEAMLLRQDCGVDFRRYCSGVRFGGGRVLACLKGNADRLSPRCATALEAIRHGR
jgi:cysteine rich repeat protein